MNMEKLKEILDKNNIECVYRDSSGDEVTNNVFIIWNTIEKIINKSRLSATFEINGGDLDPSKIDYDASINITITVDTGDILYRINNYYIQCEDDFKINHEDFISYLIISVFSRYEYAYHFNECVTYTFCSENSSKIDELLNNISYDKDYFNNVRLEVKRINMEKLNQARERDIYDIEQAIVKHELSMEKLEEIYNNASVKMIHQQ